MYKILASRDLAPNTREFRVLAPHVARRARPGQFLVVRADERGERIPLTIADFDPEEGSVTIIIQAVGVSTMKLCRLGVGDEFANVAGPLGTPSELHGCTTAVCLGGGFGVGAIYPVVRALRGMGTRVISIVGARTADLLLWVDRVGALSNEIHVTTDDGSAGRKGLVTDVLRELLDADGGIGLVHAVGPLPMMRAVGNTTKPYGVRTLVSLNPLMIDATGLCGVCRVTIGGQVKFACVDGPDFEAHDVDWAELASRQRLYMENEKEALARFQCQACETGA